MVGGNERENKKRSIRYSKQRNFMRRSKAEALENALKKEAEKNKIILSMVKRACEAKTELRRE